LRTDRTKQDALQDRASVLAALPHKAGTSLRVAEFFAVLAGKKLALVTDLIRDRKLRPEVRALAVDGLCKTAPAELLGLLDGLLTPETEAPVLAALIRCMATLHHPRSLSMVRDYLSNADWTLRLAAAEAAGLLGIADEQLLDQLSQALGSVEWPVRLAATNSMIELGAPGLQRLRMLESDPTASGRGMRAASAALTGLERASA
jgi:HEAT repeat protein